MYCKTHVFEAHFHFGDRSENGDEHTFRDESERTCHGYRNERRQRAFENKGLRQKDGGEDRSRASGKRFQRSRGNCRGRNSVRRRALFFRGRGRGYRAHGLRIFGRTEQGGG